MESLAAITFDVWETLIHDAPDLEARRVELRAARLAPILRGAGVPAGPEALVAAYEAALPEMEAVWAEHRDFGTPEQVAFVLRQLEPRLAEPVSSETLAGLADAYARVAFEIPPEPDRDVRRVLADVRGRGLRVGLICNTGRTPGWVLRELFRRFGFLDYIEALAFSDEERVRKPEPSIFRGVLERLGVAPARAAHVGDDPRTDVAGSKGVGMRAILLGPLTDVPLPVEPDARLRRLGDLPALLDAWG